MGVSKRAPGLWGRGVAQGALQDPLPLSSGGSVVGPGVLGSNCPSVLRGSSTTLPTSHPPGFHGKKAICS